MAAKKYIIVSSAIILLGATYFFIGTKNHNPKQEFANKKQNSLIKTGDNLSLILKNSVSQETPKVVEIFGEIDQNAITVTASMPSVVKSIQSEGSNLKKNQPVVRFINDLTVPMPFNGKIANTFVKNGETISTGQQLFVAIPTSKFSKINIEMPIAYISSLEKGMSVEIEYNSNKYTGRILHISPYSKQESGWTKVVVEMPYANIPHNAIAKVVIELSRHFAHFIPKTAIFLQDGLTFVKILNDSNKVTSSKVEIIQETQDGFYVAGLEDSARIVVKNPAYAINDMEYQFTFIE